MRGIDPVVPFLLPPRRARPPRRGIEGGEVEQTWTRKDPFSAGGTVHLSAYSEVLALAEGRLGARASGGFRNGASYEWATEASTTRSVN